MLNYSSEVWGLDADHTPIERVHLFALKRSLNTSLHTPNLMVYSKTGQYPLFVNIYVKCIKFWLHILKMPPCCLPFKVYKMLLHLHEQNRRTWASSVCCVLYKYDFDDVWVNQGVGDEKAFLKEFNERVLSLYSQEWDNSIRTKERCTVYSTFKSSSSLAPYLNELKHIKARNFLIRLRLSVSPLRTHKLRYCKDATPFVYFCPFCKSDMENEVHFILVSPKYAEIREQYISKKYFTSPYSCKLALLLATTSTVLLLRLAIYVMKAFTI